MIWQPVDTAANVVSKEYIMNKITLHLTEEESRIYGYGLVPYRKMIHPSGEFLLDPPEQWTLRGQLIEQYEAKICWETLDSLLTDDSHLFNGTDLVIDPVVALFMLLKLFDAYYTMAFTYDVKQVQKETRADLKKNYESNDPNADWYLERAMSSRTSLQDYACVLYDRLSNGYHAVLRGAVEETDEYALGKAIFSTPEELSVEAPLYEFREVHALIYELNPVMRLLDKFIHDDLSIDGAVEEGTLTHLYLATKWELMDKYLEHILDCREAVDVMTHFYFTKESRRMEYGDLYADPIEFQAEWEDYRRRLEEMMDDVKPMRLEYEKQVLDSIYDKLAAAIDAALRESHS